MKLNKSTTVGEGTVSTIEKASAFEQRSLNSMIQLANDNPDTLKKINFSNLWRTYSYLHPYHCQLPHISGMLGTLTFAHDVTTLAAQEKVDEFLTRIMNSTKLLRLLCVAERGGKNQRWHYHILFFFDTKMWLTDDFLNFEMKIESLWKHGFSNWKWIDSEPDSFARTIHYVSAYLSQTLRDFGFYYKNDNIQVGLHDYGTHEIKSMLMTRIPEFLTTTGLTTSDLISVARSLSIGQVRCPLRLIQSVYAEMRKENAWMPEVLIK